MSHMRGLEELPGVISQFCWARHAVRQVFTLGLCSVEIPYLLVNVNLDHLVRTKAPSGWLEMPPVDAAALKNLHVKVVGTCGFLVVRIELTGTH